MPKVAVIYVAQTNHILACVTTVAGEPDPHTPVSDLVGAGVPLREKTGAPVVFFPSGLLKVAVLDVSRGSELLVTPQEYSLSFGSGSQPTTSVNASASAISIVSATSKGLDFTYANGGTLNCICALQKNVRTLGRSNPATPTVESQLGSNNFSTDYRMGVKIQAGDAFALLVETVSPLIQ